MSFAKKPIYHIERQKNRKRKSNSTGMDYPVRGRGITVKQQENEGRGGAGGPGTPGCGDCRDSVKKHYGGQVWQRISRKFVIY